MEIRFTEPGGTWPTSDGRAGPGGNGGGPAHLTGWRAALESLRGGDAAGRGRAAWVLTAVAPACRVLAGQMVPGWERYRPGLLLEWLLLLRAWASAGYTSIDWGPAVHVEALIAAD